ncbi:MAG TPA: SAM-dependent methyltransferase [Pseudonocardia sp.]|uniref:SAM-dependent methyltransferase n=1 Tax=Pseudonocardia sp. TaxID=60912 RepID=UPI002B4B0595|nr:SAM-dependent methyltransferase [Pseudonocardia sp.]HLU56744.1 SAM-dependent methyltransferase [Pseudonocardia sp.]
MNDVPEIDTTVPHGARTYDYWLGGKDNYAADRALGDQIRQRIPTISAMALANRAFLTRAVRYLARDAGIRQFLDIGTGIPTAPNVHQVAQAVNPAARVVYVDNDPIVLAHARALMTSTPEGRTSFLLGDFTDPDAILASPQLRETLDLGEPVGLLLVAMLMYFDPAEGEDPYPVVETLVDALPAGSHVAISHPTADFAPDAMADAQAVIRQSGITFVARDHAEVTRFFAGLELVDPGVVPVLGWRPDEQDTGAIDEKSAYYWAGVAKKV